MQSSQIANSSADTNYGAISHTYTDERKSFGVGDDVYNVRVVLYNDGDVKVELENVLDKHLWTVVKKPKETLELTKLGGIEMTPKAFTNLLCEAIRGADADVRTDLSVGTDDSRVIHLKWRIPIPGVGSMEKEFTLELQNAGRSDADRVARMMRDVDAQRGLDNVEKIRNVLREVEQMRKHYDMFFIDEKTIAQKNAERLDAELSKFTDQFWQLKDELERMRIQHAPVDSNVRYVTVYNDTEERPYDMTTLTFNVNKRFKESILLITANLCVVGTNCAHLVQTWIYGHDGGKQTIAYGQTENYHKEGDKIPRSIPCMCVIKDHDVTGDQPLTLRWRFSHVIPFKTINPKTSSGQAADLHQPTSVVKVEEIMP